MTRMELFIDAREALLEAIDDLIAELAAEEGIEMRRLIASELAVVTAMLSELERQQKGAAK